MSDSDSPSSTDPSEVTDRTDHSRGLSAFLASLSWPVVVAATVLALLAGGGVILLAAGGSDDDTSADPGDDGAITLEEPAVPKDDPLGVEVTLQDGSTQPLRDILGDKPTVVNFFASWCPPCIAEMPDFQTVSQEAGTEVDFIGVALQDRPEDASRIVEQTGITYPWYRDIRGDLLAAFGGIQMPSTVFIDADGSILELKSGTVSINELRGRLGEHFEVRL